MKIIEDSVITCDWTFDETMKPLTVLLQKVLQPVGSCNTLNDLSNKLCTANKIEDLNKYVFNMITGQKCSKHFNQRYIIQI